MFKIIGRIKKVSDIDMNFVKKDDEYVVFGRGDKSIGIVSNGEIINLSPILNVNSTIEGYLTIPTSSGDFVIQWGTANIQADSTGTFDFPIEFPNACFKIVGSHEENDTITSLSIKAISNSQYTVTITGGSSGENISWIAIGY